LVCVTFFNVGVILQQNIHIATHKHRVRKVFLILALLGTVFVAHAQKLFGGDFKRQAAQNSTGQAFSYRFACTFYADKAGAAALPAQLRFRVIRKRDNATVRDFMVKKDGDAPKTTVYSECILGNSPPQFEYLSVLYAHETTFNPGEFNDSEGYYIINDAPAVPRAATANIKSPNVVLYHWFAPEYLFEKLDNADQGRAATGLVGAYTYMCRNAGKSLRIQLSVSPLVKVFNPQALDLTARNSVPFTDGELPFKKADWQGDFTPNQPTGGDLYVTDSKPKFDNNSEITHFEGWNVPTENGIFSLAFVTEQRRNGVKLAENSLEMYAEVNDCKKISYVSINITEAGTTNPGGTSFCRNKPIQINSVASESGMTYQWYKDQKPIVGATNPQLVVRETGAYFLKAKQEGACSESTTMTVNAIAINCGNDGPPAILGSNLHDMINATGPSKTGYINHHSFRAIYYTPLADLAKMPKSLTGVVYRKRDNQRMDEVQFKRNTLADVTHLLDRLCDKSVDSVQQVTYDSSIEFAPDRYNDQQGYYLSAEPICCRANADNLSRNGSSVVTYLELGPANQVKAHNSIQRGHTVDLNIPFMIKGCAGQPARVFLYAGNRENITAQFGGFTEVMEGSEDNKSFRTMSWASSYSADNFTGNEQTRFWVEPRRNGQMVMIGVPDKPGVFVYRLRINGISSGQVYSSVYQEFRLEVNDCTPAPQSRVVVSKVGQPNVAVSPELCQDSLVQLNLKNFRSWATLQWSVNKSAIANATDSILVVPKNQSGAYTCTIRMPRQCPEFITTDPQNITFLPRPPIAITAKGTTLCEGLNLPLTAQSDADARSFQWFFENKTLPNATQNSFGATQTGAYTVTVTNSKGCSNTSAPYQTKVNPLPKSEIKSAKDYFCEGEQLTLSANVATGQTYQWQREGQPVGGNNSELIVLESATYSLKITNELGCNSMVASTTIRKIAKPAAVILAPASQICQNERLVLTAQTPAEKPQYEWLFENKSVASNTQATFEAQNAGNYTVRVTDTYGCVGISAPQSLKINPLPQAVISTPRNTVCEGTKLGITANFTSGYQYEWQQNGKAIIGQSNLLEVGQTGSYVVKVRTTFGCARISEPVQIQQVKNPSVQISAPTNRICQGTPLDLLAVGENLQSFEWKQNGQLSEASTQRTFPIKQTGQYTVTVKDLNNCVGISTPFAVEVLVQVVVKMDSLPSFCGVAFAPIQLQASPAGGIFSGKGVTDNLFAPRAAGIGQHTVIYTVRGDLACLNGSAQRTVNIRSAPYLDLGAEREIFRGTTVRLNADMGKGYTYQWTPPTWIDNPTVAKPRIDPDSTTIYVVLATGPDGCVSEDSIKITVAQRIFMPDIFTPNGDGLNDTWQIIGRESYPDMVVTIYNRWGSVVYHAKGPNQKPFDGTYQGEPLPDGTYAYVIQAKPNGHIDRGSVIIGR
jgi:gliding motility-associated-like protein